MNVGFISLGCSKNLVDTEMLIGKFKNNKYKIVNDSGEADIIVVNTCGFIKSAKEEAIDTILEMAQYKNNRCKYLIVMGCLVQRYKEEIQKAIPEIDLCLSIDEYDNIWEKIDELVNIEKDKTNKCLELDYMERVVTTGNKMAYLKIAEGCDNKCTYCAIPYIRGPYISRNKEDILKEAKKLAKEGIKELIVIAQDTTKYGLDIYGKSYLPELLEDICKIEEVEWVRFLYAYPESITDELIKVVKKNDKICNYFDIPIQHISDSILKKMNRKSSGKNIKELIYKIRKEIPDVIIRTSLIVGFPGETEVDFEELYNFVNTTKFDRLGTFMYSKEDNTPAEKLKNHIHPMTKKSRYNKIMKLQKEISINNQKEKVGNIYTVLLEGKSFDNKYYIGRTYMDVPDMDGVIYIKRNFSKKEMTKKDLTGVFINVKIIEYNEYDLIAEQI